MEARSSARIKDTDCWVVPKACQKISSIISHSLAELEMIKTTRPALAPEYNIP